VETYLLIAADLVAVGLLTFALYMPRHRRRDLVPAFLVVNAGVLAVALVLGASGAGIGLGLGLFGVLSIIRLRSSEIEQHEVAYYFAALALGLIGGLGSTAPWVSLALMAMVLTVVAIGDHPALFRRYRQQRIRLERAIADEAALIAHLEGLLGARVHGVKVEELDLVNDLTVVDVRYRIGARERAGSGTSPASTPASASAFDGTASASSAERTAPVTALPPAADTEVARR
jgi:hypothetical protein